MRKPDDPTASTERGEERSFYGRWSRRKHLARTSPASPEPGVPVRDRQPHEQPPALAQPLPDADPVPESSEPPPRELTDADMPALDTLGEDDDFSGFMSPGVSEALRAKALRKLFMSSKFNVVDGLNDYDDDFTTFEALGDIITSDMRHLMQVEAEKARAKAEEEAGQETPATLAEDTEAAPAAGERDEAAVEHTRDAPGQLPDAAQPDGGGTASAGNERTPSGNSRDVGETLRDS